MRWHLIAAVVIIAVFFSEEILAKPPKYRPQSTKVTVAVSKPKNKPANRRPVSTSVTPYRPQKSLFKDVSSLVVSRPAPAAESSLSSHFLRLKLSPSRPSSSSQSENPLKPTISGGARTTSEERWSNIRNKPDKYQPKQPNAIKLPISSRVSVSGSIIHKRPGRPGLKPSLKELYASIKKQQSEQPVSRTPSSTPRPVPNRPNSPPPTNANNPVANRQPTPVNNPEPGPVFQPPAPETLVQIAAAPAPGSKAALGAQKKLDKKERVLKSKGNAQAALQQVNDDAGTCKDPTAPASACFDFYILSVSWGITMQVRRLGNTNMINKAEWGVHGLWPAMKNYGKHPKHCNLKIPYDPKQILPIQDELENIWFSANGSPMTHQAFWRHEWEKHGTCVARSPQIKSVKDYFEKGLELFDQVDVQAKLNAANFRTRSEMTNKDMHHEISRILGHRVTLKSIHYPVRNSMIMIMIIYQGSP
ncbi:proteoglycan 4-like [Cotesia glomerata]|uniref:proteoglycan 4-like n=1 Tax=Cotesia glomerata TaxID=32391 RepID=UPI001D007514|nr:proteoglycan 4-like [Cotesia glomerata]